MWTVVLLVLLVALLLGGVGWHSYGIGGLSPLAVVLVAILILWLLGYLKA